MHVFYGIVLSVTKVTDEFNIICKNMIVGHEFCYKYINHTIIYMFKLLDK
jgi:hypothetical protein